MEWTNEGLIILEYEIDRLHLLFLRGRSHSLQACGDFSEIDIESEIGGVDEVWSVMRRSSTASDILIGMIFGVESGWLSDFHSGCLSDFLIKVKLRSCSSFSWFDGVVRGMIVTEVSVYKSPRLLLMIGSRREFEIAADSC